MGNGGGRLRRASTHLRQHHPRSTGYQLSSAQSSPWTCCLHPGKRHARPNRHPVQSLSIGGLIDGAEQNGQQQSVSHFGSHFEAPRTPFFYLIEHPRPPLLHAASHDYIPASCIAVTTWRNSPDPIPSQPLSRASPALLPAPTGSRSASPTGKAKSFYPALRSLRHRAPEGWSLNPGGEDMEAVGVGMSPRRISS
jgi:hypothetical protein